MKTKVIVRLSIMLLFVLNITTVLVLARGKSEKAVLMTKDTIGGNTFLDEFEEMSLPIEVNILADTDLGKRTEAPIVAKVGQAVNLSINYVLEDDCVKVRGANKYEVILEPIEEGKWQFVPNRAGRFEVVVITSEGNERFSRLITVQDVNREDFYQLSKLKEEQVNGDLTFSTGIYSKPKNTEGNEAIPVTRFTIGEPGIWTKTIKDYTNDRTSITEGKDFKLDRGMYTVNATLKDYYSLSAEDSKSLTYEKAAADGHKVTINEIKQERIPKSDGSGELDHFTVDATCDHGCELVYAFIIDDSLGAKTLTGSINGYTDSKEVTCPVIPWRYEFVVRVKHKENSEAEKRGSDKLLLPNSYEAIQTRVVEGKVGGYQEDIKIESVTIQGSLLEDFYKDKSSALQAKQVIKGDNTIGAVYVNSNNYITVNLPKDQAYRDYTITAWVIDDERTIALEPVYDEETNYQGNCFIYYPQSGGSSQFAENSSETHELYIMAIKTDELGSVRGKTTKIIELEVK